MAMQRIFFRARILPIFFLPSVPSVWPFFTIRKEVLLSMNILYFCISFAASIIGAICGIGGGVIIKPALDLFQLDSAATINFLSGCTVLGMSCYSFINTMRQKTDTAYTSTALPLALGAAAGGIIGKQLFTNVCNFFPDSSLVRAIQSVCLGIITIGTLIYTINKSRIRPLRITSKIVSALIGFILGIMSSFLGIGGGPINLVVLGFFFSMDTKTAATNSLYIIFFSQVASSLYTVLGDTVPPFSPDTLLLMVGSGIFGGIVGRKINKHLSNRSVDRLFVIVLIVIIAICIYNALQAL